MKRITVVLVAVASLACGSSRGLQQDVGEARVTESKSDVRGCDFVTRVTADVDLREFEGDREAAMQQLLDRLRNNALHKRCDTVYLITVEESTTHLQARGEGYRCESVGITDGPMGGSHP